MSPLSFPMIERVEQRGEARSWRATCRTCGWQSKVSGTKTEIDYLRRLHGPEKTCTKAVGS